ncbi:MAG: hypothetical protein KKD44_26520 [Proteobacteria bacterium]|nr:hypothetical protein [Pseudomonadota bacterium]
MQYESIMRQLIIDVANTMKAMAPKQNGESFFYTESQIKDLEALAMRFVLDIGGEAREIFNNCDE